MTVQRTTYTIARHDSRTLIRILKATRAQGLTAVVTDRRRATIIEVK